MPETEPAQRMGKGMMYAAWIVALGLLTLGFNDWIDGQDNPNRRVKSSASAHAVEVQLQQNRHGHYRASGEINGHRVEFLVDTGATEVSVPARLAEEIGLARGTAGQATTANGVVTTYATRLARLRLGDIELDDVRAHINPGMSGDEVLLGMSVLRHLEFAQRDGTLTLRQIR